MAWKHDMISSLAACRRAIHFAFSFATPRMVRRRRRAAIRWAPNGVSTPVKHFEGAIVGACKHHDIEAAANRRMAASGHPRYRPPDSARAAGRAPTPKPKSTNVGSRWKEAKLLIFLMAPHELVEGRVAYFRLSKHSTYFAPSKSIYCSRNRMASASLTVITCFMPMSIYRLLMYARTK